MSEYRDNQSHLVWRDNPSIQDSGNARRFSSHSFLWKQQRECRSLALFSYSRDFEGREGICTSRTYYKQYIINSIEGREVCAYYSADARSQIWRCRHWRSSMVPTTRIQRRSFNLLTWRSKEDHFNCIERTMRCKINLNHVRRTGQS